MEQFHPLSPRKQPKEGKAHIKSLGSGTSAVGAGVDGLGKPNQDFDPSDFGGSGHRARLKRSKPPKANGMGEPGEKNEKNLAIFLEE